MEKTDSDDFKSVLVGETAAMLDAMAKFLHKTWRTSYLNGNFAFIRWLFTIKNQTHILSGSFENNKIDAYFRSD